MAIFRSRFGCGLVLFSFLILPTLLTSCAPKGSTSSSGKSQTMSGGEALRSLASMFGGANAESTDSSPTLFIENRTLRDSEGEIFGHVEIKKNLGTGDQIHSYNSDGLTTSLLPQSFRRGSSAEGVEEVISDAVGVIVELHEEALATTYVRTKGKGMREQADRIEAQQLRVKSRLEAKAKRKLVSVEKKKSKDTIRTRRFKDGMNGFALLDLSVSEAKKLLEKDPDVKRVSPNITVKLDLLQSVPQMNANPVWQYVSSAGAPLDGTGMRIGIIDTGVDYTHADLGGCLGPSCKVMGGYDFVNNDANPIDDHGHGTHVSATAAGNGTLKLSDGTTAPLLGVAPSARIYGYKVLNSGGSGSSDAIIGAIERCADPNQDGNYADRLDVCSLSLGGGGNPDDAMSQAVDRITALGVVFTIAAGNSGPAAGTIGSPGTSRSAITVAAACKTSQIGADTICTTPIAKFSSVGPVIWTDSSGNQQKIAKPDIAAPGHLICAAQFGTWLSDRTCGAGHIAISGTSMATPHVAGAVALLRQAYPDATPSQIKTLLMTTSRNLGVSPDFQGAGHADVMAALSAAGIPSSKVKMSGLPVLFRDDVTNLKATFTKNISITNTSANPLNYAASYLGSTPGVGVTLSPTNLSIPVGGEASLTVTMSVDHSVVASSQSISGKVVLQSAVDGDLTFSAGVIIGNRLKSDRISLDYGLDLASLTTWSADQTIQLTNTLLDSSATYSVSATMNSGSSYITVKPSVSQLTIPAGTTAPLVLSITATNASLGNQVFNGLMKITSATQSIEVPFSFFKGYIIRLDLGTTPPFEVVSYKPGSPIKRSIYTYTTSGGIYDIRYTDNSTYSLLASWPGNAPAYVLQENLTPGDGSVILPLNRDLAVNPISLNLTPPEGTSYRIPELNFSLVDTSSLVIKGHGYIVYDAQGVKFYTNNLPSRFRITMYAAGVISGTDTRAHWAIEKYGNTGPYAFTNALSDFIPKRVVALMNRTSAPGKVGIAPVTIYPGVSSFQFISANDPTDRPFTYYFMSNQPRLSTSSLPYIPMLQYFTYSDTFEVQSDYFFISKDEEVHLSYPTSAKTAAEAVKNYRLPTPPNGVIVVGAGPVYDTTSWNVNSSRSVNLLGGYGTGYTHAWNGSFDFSTPSSTATLSVNGTVAGTASLGWITSQAWPNTPAGDFHFEMSRPTLLRGVSGISTTVTDFNVPTDTQLATQRVDMNAPSLYSAQLLANGIMQAVVDSTVTNQLKLALRPNPGLTATGTLMADAIASVDVGLSTDGVSFTPASVATTAPNEYLATLPTLSASTNRVTVRISAKDLRGNSLVTSFQLPTGQALPASLAIPSSPAPEPSPTPSPIPAPSPSPSPMPVPSPSPSPAPVPSPSPSPVPVPSDTIPPTVAITSPANGATVARRSSINIAVNASDVGGVASVQILVNGTAICTDTVAPYVCTYKAPNARGRALRIDSVATDKAGNRASATSVTVTTN